MATRWFGPEAPELRRLSAAVVVGILATAVASVFAPWQLDVLVFWDTTSATFLVAVWRDIARRDSAQTAAAATREDETRRMTRVVLVVASTVSLVGIGVTLVKANQSGRTGAIVLSAGAIVTVIMSWAVVHTTYTLRYAHLYYIATPGGIDFKGDDPDYLDFAYLAFTLGMTYQVSDTDIGDRGIRRAALGHALLSYLFGTVIIATTINIVASFV